jgi:hypothetical protein
MNDSVLVADCRSLPIIGRCVGVQPCGIATCATIRIMQAITWGALARETLPDGYDKAQTAFPQKKAGPLGNTT